MKNMEISKCFKKDKNNLYVTRFNHICLIHFLKRDNHKYLITEKKK